MSGETRGFLKRFWKAAPAQASAAPTASAATMRGVRTCRTSASTFVASPLSPPAIADQSARITSPAPTGKRPTEKLHSRIATRAALAVTKTRVALFIGPL